MDKFKKLGRYLLDLSKESSTWQGIGFFVGIFYADLRGFNWGEAAFIGAAISNGIKVLSRDKKKTKKEDKKDV